MSDDTSTTPPPDALRSQLAAAIEQFLRDDQECHLFFGEASTMRRLRVSYELADIMLGQLEESLAEAGRPRDRDRKSSGVTRRYPKPPSGNRAGGEG